MQKHSEFRIQLLILLSILSEKDKKNLRKKVAPSQDIRETCVVVDEKRGTNLRVQHTKVKSLVSGKENRNLKNTLNLNSTVSFQDVI